MNLTQNPRMENFEISDDAALYVFMSKVVDEVFQKVPRGSFNRGKETTEGILDFTPDPGPLEQTGHEAGLELWEDPKQWENVGQDLNF